MGHGVRIGQHRGHRAASGGEYALAVFALHLRQAFGLHVRPEAEVGRAGAELQQVVLNFVVNAEQAILMSGRLPGRITVRARDDGGGRVLLEVEDTGPGVPPENEAKLFQPFFTTKPVGQGTGLGLSVSYGIIDSLEGHIGYRRAPAGGAIFYFDLPAASESLV